MVLTRRNRQQLGITPGLNEAALFFRHNRRRVYPPSSPARSRSGSVASDTGSWFSQLSDAQQERVRQWIKRYGPNDHAHRHRLPDDQPKSVRVISYTRRN
jgi:hypothetical protein